MCNTTAALTQPTVAGHHPILNPDPRAQGPENGLLDAAKGRVKGYLNNPDCAALFDNPNATRRMVDKISFKDLGKLAYVTDGDTIKNVGGPTGQTESLRLGSYTLLSSIFLNSQVNWANPNKTTGLLNGKPFTIAALTETAKRVDVDNISPAHFMDLNILHELSHYNGKLDPDSKGAERQLWDKCIMGSRSLI
jgi:hypothetical protein